MKAVDAVNGQYYRLEPRTGRPEGDLKALCQGMNGLNTGILFLVYDEYGKRKMLLLPVNEEVKEAK